MIIKIHESKYPYVLKTQIAFFFFKVGSYYIALVDLKFAV